MTARPFALAAVAFSAGFAATLVTVLVVDALGRRLRTAVEELELADVFDGWLR